MRAIETSVVIGAPPEAVVAVLLDGDAAPEWTSGLTSLELVEGDPGEPGCVGLAHYDEGGSRYVLTDRLVAVTPNEHYVSEISGGGLEARVETTLEALDASRTRVTVRWSGSGANPVTRLVLPLMRGRIAKRSADDLRALGALVESR